MRRSPLCISASLSVLAFVASSAGSASAQSIVLADSGKQVIRDCSGRDTVVSGSHYKVVLSGGCRSLRVSGDANDIIVDMAAGSKIELHGNYNNVAWAKVRDGADPAVKDRGDANSVVEFRREEASRDAPRGADAVGAPEKPKAVARSGPAGDAARDAVDAAKSAAASKSLRDIKKDLGVKQEAMGEMAEMPNEVMFGFDSDKLLPGAINILAECAEMIKRDNAKGMRVIGHTDAVGPLAYNITLSKRRAQTVRTWLVAEGGIPAADLVAIGMGPNKPKATNSTVAGRMQNRRVEVVMPMGQSPHQPLPDKTSSGEK